MVLLSLTLIMYIRLTSNSALLSLLVCWGYSCVPSYLTRNGLFIFLVRKFYSCIDNKVYKIF